MPNERGKSVDTTYLSIDTVENRYLIHRDYIAHCHRWSHAVKTAMRMRGDLFVLDIGCGREMPLAKALYTNKIGANKYCGIDYYYNVEVPEMLKGNGVFPIRLIKNADAAKIDVLDRTDEETGKVSPGIGFQPNLVTMFEVFEHVEPRHGRAMLENIRRIMRPDGVFLFSTPCFNGKAAGNHVAEPEYEVMGATLEDAGFAVLGHWGTFASITDYRDALYDRYGDDGYRMFEELKTYYDVNYLASVFAPLFPDRSRNAMWELVTAEWYQQLYGVPYSRRFPPRLEVKPRYSFTGSSSSDDDVLDQAMYERWLKENEPTAPKVEVPGTVAPATFADTQGVTLAIPWWPGKIVADPSLPDNVVRFVDEASGNFWEFDISSVTTLVAKGGNVRASYEPDQQEPEPVEPADEEEGEEDGDQARDGHPADRGPDSGDAEGVQV